MSSPVPASVPYGGIASRAIALAVDAFIAQGIVVITGTVLALVASLVSEAKLGTGGVILATAAWLLFVATYFVTFWSTAGQTPGMRLMGLRVETSGGEHPGFGRSVVRVIGLGLAILPFFLGFVPVLLDRRRRGLHDFMAHTVVLYAREPEARPPGARNPSGASPSG